jgi:hypothetical protein
MGAPKGNRNATKNRRWAQAIDKALKQYNEGDVTQGHAMDAIARRLVKQAIVGDHNEFVISMREIGDRIDGKALVSIEADVTAAELTDEQLQAAIDEKLRGLEDGKSG